MKNIYDYMDFRELLKDRMKIMREENPRLSYRYYNRKAGFSSPNLLQQVMSGKKRIGHKGVFAIAKLLGLGDRERGFFEALVHFDQADDIDEKEKCYEEVMRRYPMKHPKHIESKFFKIFSEWHYAAILELMHLDGFRENPHWISRKLKPSVPVLKVRKALKELEEMGLIARKGRKLARTEKAISTPEGVESVAIITYQQQLAKLGQISIEKDPVEDKVSSTLTFAIDEKSFKKIKDRIADFKADMRKIAADCEKRKKKSEVVTVNLNMFKLTERSTK